MSRRRGNPNWGHPLRPVLATPTAFETTVRRLRLLPEKYTASNELKRWCQLNKNRCYIPEWLLEEWGIDVEIGYGHDAG